MTNSRLALFVSLFVLCSTTTHAQLRMERASIDQFKAQATKFDVLTRQALASTTNSTNSNDRTLSFSLAHESARVRDRLRDLEIFLSLYSVFPRPPSINSELDVATRHLVAVQLNELVAHIRRSQRLMEGMMTKSEDKTLLFVIDQVRDELTITHQLISRLAP